MIKGIGYKVLVYRIDINEETNEKKENYMYQTFVYPHSELKIKFEG